MLVEMIKRRYRTFSRKGYSRFIKDNGFGLNVKGKIDFDMVVVCIGTKPNVDIVKGLDIKINRGILANNCLETSIKDIYAGDYRTSGQ